MAETGWVRTGPGDQGSTQGSTWQFGGAWTLAHASALDQAVSRLGAAGPAVTLDLSAVEMLDTVGARRRRPGRPAPRSPGSSLQMR